jgi:hypothetical protein
MCFQPTAGMAELGQTFSWEEKLYRKKFQEGPHALAWKASSFSEEREFKSPSQRFSFTFQLQKKILSHFKKTDEK